MMGLIADHMQVDEDLSPSRSPSHAILHVKLPAMSHDSIDAIFMFVMILRKQ